MTAASAPRTTPRTTTRRWPAAAASAVGAATLLLLAAGRPAGAMITYSSPVRLTDPPPASLLDHGYQYADQTPFNGARPIIIAPNYMLIAKHVAGGWHGGYTDALGNFVPPTTASTFGQTFTVQERFDNPDVDLSIIRVDTTFSTSLCVPLYQPGGASEVGRETFVWSRGGFMEKADELFISETGQSPSYAGQRAGWTLYNMGDSGRISWGQNRVRGLVSDNGSSIVDGDDYLEITFDAPGQGDNIYGDAVQQGNETMASFGDSSGCVFIEQDGQWRLAGLIWAVGAGVYSTQTDSGPYLGAFYDMRGMWYDNGQGGRDYIADDNPVPIGFYSSRISKQMDWINRTTNFTVPAVTAVPEGGTLALIGPGAALPLLAAFERRRRRSRRS
jgi:hypothetical protein